MKGEGVSPPSRTMGLASSLQVQEGQITHIQYEQGGSFLQESQVRPLGSPVQQGQGQGSCQTMSHWRLPSRSSMCLCPRANSSSHRPSLRLQPTQLSQVWGWTLRVSGAGGQA